MCLIAYVPDGRELDADVYASAFADNEDGIGIMSRLGVVKFLGKKMLKKAKRYIRTQLAPGQVEYAIHFRFATHGDVNLANTHPFVLPTGKDYMMHNGVISWCGYDKSRSDTGIFADLLGDYETTDKYLDDLSKLVGYGNKLCIMDAAGKFSLVNADAGLWDRGVWYSQTYSLPDRLNPWAGKKWSYAAAAVLPARKLAELPGEPLDTFKDSRTWLQKYDEDAEAHRYAPRWWSGTDYDSDLRLLPVRSQRLDDIASQRDDDSPTDLHDGCGLPVPHGYREKSESQRAYYRGLESDGAVLDDDYAELGIDLGELTEDEVQQQLDNVLLSMRRNGAA